MDLLELARVNPDITISIKIGDLLAAARTIIADTRAELEGTIASSRADYLIPSDKVVEILAIDKSTLYRWSKCGYLNPVRRGRKVFYKYSDVEPLLNGRRNRNSNN